jgi:hypothetical protein
MITQVSQTQAEFYGEFLMARKAFDPRDFGVDLPHAEFVDRMVDEFNGTYKGSWTIDELCLHPREALRFCDDVRRKFGFYDAPDDVILRSIMNARKHPGG